MERHDSLLPRGSTLDDVPLGRGRRRQPLLTEDDDAALHHEDDELPTGGRNRRRQKLVTVHDMQSAVREAKEEVQLQEGEKVSNLARENEDLHEENTSLKARILELEAHAHDLDLRAKGASPRCEQPQESQFQQVVRLAVRKSRKVKTEEHLKIMEALQETEGHKEDLHSKLDEAAQEIERLRGECQQLRAENEDCHHDLESLRHDVLSEAHMCQQAREELREVRELAEARGRRSSVGSVMQFASLHGAARASSTGLRRSCARLSTSGSPHGSPGLGGPGGNSLLSQLSMADSTDSPPHSEDEAEEGPGARRRAPHQDSAASRPSAAVLARALPSICEGGAGAACAETAAAASAAAELEEARRRLQAAEGGRELAEREAAEARRQLRAEAAEGEHCRAERQRAEASRDRLAEELKASRDELAELRAATPDATAAASTVAGGRGSVGSVGTTATIATAAWAALAVARSAALPIAETALAAAAQLGGGASEEEEEVARRRCLAFHPDARLCPRSQSRRAAAAAARAASAAAAASRLRGAAARRPGASPRPLLAPGSAPDK